MSLNKIRVSLKDNPYDILISENEKDFINSLKKIIKPSSFFVITDSNVAKLHLAQFSSLLSKAGYKVKTAVIKAGETGKSIKSLSSLYDKALESGIDRKSCAIALGGGVVGDIAGFFAATYMRGIKFVQVPTTLLAMTDSSVGGKTAVNTTGGKNIAGAFYQPAFVWINSSYLITLPERQIKNGLAEVLKYSFTFDKKFYSYLLDLLLDGFISSDEFNYMIYRSCLYKASVVEKDEKETKGLREVLNFGHTLAHALETYTEYKKFLHGEAVAAGMLFAARLSVSLKLCPARVYLQVKELLTETGLVFKHENYDIKKLTDLMKKDKKSVEGSIRFVLLKDIGTPVSGIAVKDSVVVKELIKFFKESK